MNVAVGKVVLATVGVVAAAGAAAGVWSRVGKGLVGEDRAESNCHAVSREVMRDCTHCNVLFHNILVVSITNRRPLF